MYELRKIRVAKKVPSSKNVCREHFANSDKGKQEDKDKSCFWIYIFTIAFCLKGKAIGMVPPVYSAKL